MKILTDSEQAAKPASGDEPPELLDLAGAYYLAPERTGDPVLYVLLGADDAAKILDDADEDRRALHILASTEEKVRRILHQRYPAPRGGTLVQRVASVFYAFCRERETYYGRSRSEWHTRKLGPSFVLLDKPLFAAADTAERCQAICQEHGPILITAAQFEAIFGRSHEHHRGIASAEEAGFVVTPRNLPGVVQINYNPAAFDLREYRQRKKEYEDRTCGEFDQDVLQAMFKTLSPGNWPPDHPFNGVVRTLELEERRGWGHTRTHYQGVNQVIALLAMNRKLWNKPWWRNADDDNSARGYRRYYDNGAMRDAVEKALQYLHGVEDRYRRELDKHRSDCRGYYASYVERCQERWDLRQRVQDTLSADGCPHEPVDAAEVDSELSDLYFYAADQANVFAPQATEAQYLAEQLPRQAHEALKMLGFCRWLRREAKAMKIKLPPKPVCPKTPAQEQQARARKGRTHAHPDIPGVQSDPAQPG